MSQQDESRIYHLVITVLALTVTMICLAVAYKLVPMFLR